jgi:hypothetical protein
VEFGESETSQVQDRRVETGLAAFDPLDSMACAAALKAGKKFYVYVLLRPNGQPFYVGKGLGRRVFNHEMEARNTTLKTYKLNVIRAIMKEGGAVSYALPRFCDDEIEAHALEVALIAKLGRHDLKRGPLTNQTDGGEGVTGLSEETMVRKAANLGGLSEDPERRVANEFFHSIAGQQDSVPIKPLGVRRLEHTTPHPQPRSPKDRMAKTVVAAALATNQLLGVSLIFPRMFAIRGTNYVIENGVARDMLKAGMISVFPGERPEWERFELTQLGYTAILNLLTKPRLEDLGVLEPELR